MTLDKSARAVLCIIGFFGTSISAQAEIYDVWFNADTRDSAGIRTITFWVGVKDNKFANLRDAVESVTIIAPDSTNIVLDLDIHYDRTTPDKGFWYQAVQSEFNSGNWPSGVYAVKVKDINTGKIITQKDRLKISWLAVPTIMSPASGALVGPTPLLRWSKVPGAKYYRISIWDNTWSEPVYSWLNREQILNVSGTSFRIPRGILKPGHNYSWRVEARDGLQDRERRSRSAWVDFDTRNF